MQVPDEVFAAKKSAVSSFLVVRTVQPAFTTFAATVVPQQNVVGVGIGYKIAKGKIKGHHVVRLYVERKVTPDAIADDYLLPKEINGVETDVIEAGRFLALMAKRTTRSPKRPKSGKANAKHMAAAKSNVPLYQQKLRPAQPGCSVGFQFSGAKAGYVMAGTFGALVKDDAGKLYILSNNHVLANENALKIGSPIFQPGLLDGGDAAKDQIATLTRFVTLQANVPNSVDCAIAAVDKAADVSATVLAKVNRLKSATPIDAADKMKVHKVGRTSGYSTGSIFDISADVKVGYDLGTLSFQNQMLIQGDTGAFSAAGDSGSLIVDRESGQPTGLLFAGSSQYTIANHIADVLKQLQVSVVR